MNSLARKYFHSETNFSEVRILSEDPHLKWEDLKELPSDLPRSWFELSRLSPQDRIDFTRDYWLSSLPFNPVAHPMLFEFFQKLEDISVILRKEQPEDLFFAELIYSVKDESTFFRGLPPPKEQEINELKREIEIIFPRDFLSFIHIHNGFGKLSELGLIRIEEMAERRRKVMDLVLQAPETIKSGQTAADAGALVPFFEVVGLSSYQCFFTDWYPGSEMGNVYLSGIDYTLSDTKDRRMWAENLAFPSFLEWLGNFLQGMNFSL